MLMMISLCEGEVSLCLKGDLTLCEGEVSLRRLISLSLKGKSHYLKGDLTLCEGHVSLYLKGDLWVPAAAAKQLFKHSGGVRRHSQTS